MSARALTRFYRPKKDRSVRNRPTPPVIPFVTQRAGEDAAPDNLQILKSGRQLRLFYQDEDQRDRDLRGVLWARCSFNPVDEHQMPTGEPEWRLMHPYRQMVTMQTMRCQICTRPARTRFGYVFLAGPKDVDPEETERLTNQPPVCARHVRTAATLCPYMEGQPTVLLTQSAPLYGVTGALYGLDGDGVKLIAKPDHPLPYGHANLPTFLASQQVRRLKSFRVLAVDELMRLLSDDVA
ncbi:hypothetical protein ACF06L_22595 [Streptomyces sp. NPDC015408]|uniref:hypothetical protein n=1 Tax=Streptomyces sp. NPDC015408 TaxID=3364956 RepID=UPI0036FDEB3A